MSCEHLNNLNCEYSNNFIVRMHELNKTAKEYSCDTVDISFIEKGLAFATHYHQGQFRKSGEPYVSHPIAVAEMAANHMFRENVIIASLLHDTLEDTTLTLDEIEIGFSPRIAQIVDRLTRKIDPTTGKKMSAGDCLFESLKLGDDEAVLVKMVDRWHNTSTIMTLSKEKQERIIRETIQDFFVLAMQNKNSNIELLLEKVLLSHKRKTTSQNYLLQASENDEAPNNSLLIPE